MKQKQSYINERDEYSYNKVGIRFKVPEKKPPKNFVKVKSSTTKSNLFDNSLIKGNIVFHERFKRGVVVSIDGAGDDKKAKIRFDKFGDKKIIAQVFKVEDYIIKKIPTMWDFF